MGSGNSARQDTPALRCPSTYLVPGRICRRPVGRPRADSQSPGLPQPDPDWYYRGRRKCNIRITTNRSTTNSNLQPILGRKAWARAAISIKGRTRFKSAQGKFGLHHLARWAGSTQESMAVSTTTASNSTIPMKTMMESNSMWAHLGQGLAGPLRARRTVAVWLHVCHEETPKRALLRGRQEYGPPPPALSYHLQLSHTSHQQ